MERDVAAEAEVGKELAAGDLYRQVPMNNSFKFFLRSLKISDASVNFSKPDKLQVFVFFIILSLEHFFISMHKIFLS